MLRKLFFLAVLVGSGYAAYKVPYHGRTVVARARYYLEHDADIHMGHAPDGKAHPTAVADRRPAEKDGAPAHLAIARHDPKEKISQSDRDALDHLIPR